jgi:hypothetical protein
MGDRIVIPIVVLGILGYAAAMLYAGGCARNLEEAKNRGDRPSSFCKFMLDPGNWRSNRP